MRTMTVEDYDYQRELIINNKKYSIDLRIYLTLALIDTFRDINCCLPHEMGVEEKEEKANA